MQGGRKAPSRMLGLSQVIFYTFFIERLEVKILLIIDHGLINAAIRRFHREHKARPPRFLDFIGISPDFRQKLEVFKRQRDVVWMRFKGLKMGAVVGSVLSLTIKPVLGYSEGFAGAEILGDGGREFGEEVRGRFAQADRKRLVCGEGFADEVVSPGDFAVFLADLVAEHALQALPFFVVFEGQAGFEVVVEVLEGGAGAGSSLPL